MNKKLVLASIVAVLLLKFWLIGLALLVALLYFILKTVNFIGNGFSLSPRTKHYSKISGGDKWLFKFNGSTENPWIGKIMNSPIYGMLPENLHELTQNVFSDPEEKILGTLWAWWGHTKQGYLILTNSNIRWVPVLPANSSHTTFKLDSVKETPGKHPVHTDIKSEEIIHIEGVHFHARGNSEGAKAFTEFHRSFIEAILHENKKTS